MLTDDKIVTMSSYSFKESYLRPLLGCPNSINPNFNISESVKPLGQFNKSLCVLEPAGRQDIGMAHLLMFYPLVAGAETPALEAKVLWVHIRVVCLKLLFQILHRDQRKVLDIERFLNLFHLGLLEFLRGALANWLVLVLTQEQVRVANWVRAILLGNHF